MKSWYTSDVSNFVIPVGNLSIKIQEIQLRRNDKKVENKEKTYFFTLTNNKNNYTFKSEFVVQKDFNSKVKSFLQKAKGFSKV